MTEDQISDCAIQFAESYYKCLRSIGDDSGIDEAVRSAVAVSLPEQFWILLTREMTLAQLWGSFINEQWPVIHENLVEMLVITAEREQRAWVVAVIEQLATYD